MLADASAIWLIPAAEEPFAMADVYRPGSSELVFDETFRQTFTGNFVKVKSGDWYDVYVRKPPAASNP
jgi:hypothetical protein